MHENLQQYRACAGRATATAPRVAAYKAPRPADLEAFHAARPALRPGGLHVVSTLTRHEIDDQPVLLDRLGEPNMLVIK